MDVSKLLTPQVLRTALLLMQKASMTGDQAYAYVQTAEAFKHAIDMMENGKEADVGHSEATD